MKLKDFTITTPGGCKIVLNGEYGVWDQTFSGTIKISGTGCPITGTFEVRSARTPPKGRGGKGLTMVFDNEDIAKAQSATWYGNTKLAAALNDPAVGGKLAEAIRASVKPTAAE